MKNKSEKERQEELEKEFKNPICKICSDDCSPSLNKKGMCIYCERGYKLAEKNCLEDFKKEIEEVIEELHRNEDKDELQHIAYTQMVLENELITKIKERLEELK